jgi:hypothetical protein
MSSASNAKTPLPPLTAVPVPAAPLPAASPKTARADSAPRFPRVNAAIDTGIGVLSFVGLGFLKPLVAMARGEDPRVHLRQLWLDLGAPVLAIAAFLFVWSQASRARGSVGADQSTLGRSSRAAREGQGVLRAPGPA